MYVCLYVCLLNLCVQGIEGYICGGGDVFFLLE